MISFLYVICSELKGHFSNEKRAHYELCLLIPQVIVSRSDQMKQRWNVVPLPSSFRSELFRWMNYWKYQAASDYESISVSALLAKHADNIFFPKIRELKILAVSPVGSTEAERSFSSIRRIHTWPRNTMTTEQLSDLAVVAMNANTVTIDKRLVCDKLSVAQHPRRMTTHSLLVN